MIITPPRQDAETARWFSDEVKPHEPTLRGYLHGLTLTSDVDDVIQETYMRLCRARARARVRSTRGLLFSTARNIALDLFRHRTVTRIVSVADIDLAQIPDHAPSTPEIVSRAQEIELLETAIMSLPPRCRAVLVLRRFENLSHREIAARLGMAEHTVEVHLTKALHRCGKFFATNGALP